MLGDALQGQRDEFVVATKFGGGQDGARGGRAAAARGAGSWRRRGQPAPAAHRPHRPLPAARARRRDADRGDAGGAHRPGPRGQGRLPRVLELRGLADRRRRLDRADRAAWSGSSRRRTATRCSTARWRTRWCRRARRSGWGCCPTSRSPTACSPASTVAASSRRSGPGRRSTRNARSGCATPTGTGSRPWRRTARSATSTLLEVAIGGLAAQPTVASVISGATSGEQVRRNAAALRWQPDEADLAELDELTSEYGRGGARRLRRAVGGRGCCRSW